MSKPFQTYPSHAHSGNKLGNWKSSASTKHSEMGTCCEKCGTWGLLSLTSVRSMHLLPSLLKGTLGCTIFGVIIFRVERLANDSCFRRSEAGSYPFHTFFHPAVLDHGFSAALPQDEAMQNAKREPPQPLFSRSHCVHKLHLRLSLIAYGIRAFD